MPIYVTLAPTLESVTPISSMPPKKDQLSQVDLRQKAYDHGIRFEGPAPPTDWPDEYRHNFEVIRALQFLRYEEYKENKQIPSIRRKEYQERVRSLRMQVRDLLNDINPNEPSWRELEGPVFEKFDKPVICRKCHNELSRSDYEANCFNNESQEKLVAKRKMRKMCTCEHKRSHEQKEDNDEEHGPVFCSVKGELITHASGDNLNNTRISMRPDGVIGLRASPYIARNESYFPVRGRNNLLLPFIVIEAKRENNAPGFRSIQYQTAFPMRRFLKAQDDIETRSSSCEPCLVWFFAYQGEQWRLHAGTIDHQKVRVYDLWQGTIHSQDGALQLLLIVDYIWSWARDVYRPAIMDLIGNSRTSFRDVSPVFADRFRHSVSLCPTISSAPTSQDTDQMQVDEIVVNFTRSQQYQGEGTAALLDASSHDFLRWAVGHTNSPFWTRLGSIRHSNIVEFEFRCYNSSAGFDSPGENYPSLYTVLSSHAVTISMEQLDDIASNWTSSSLTSETELSRTMRATFFFQTYCDESSWQIKRVLSCIIWGMEKSPIPRGCETEKFTIAMSQVRNIHGRDSVWIALRTQGFILKPIANDRGLEWKCFTQAHLPEEAFETLKGLEVGVCHKNMILRRVSLHSKLLWIDIGSDSQHLRFPVAWEQDTKTGDSMLAISSSSWPETCPNFCLFLLPEADYESSSDFSRLLEGAISMGNFYADMNYRWRREDGQILRQWRQALASEKTIVA